MKDRGEARADTNLEQLRLLLQCDQGYVHYLEYAPQFLKQICSGLNVGVVKRDFVVITRCNLCWWSLTFQSLVHMLHLHLCNVHCVVVICNYIILIYSNINFSV